eukprot:3012859-Prymnesium_polylepis.1
MYSILRSTCFFFLVDLPGTAAFFALSGRDGRSTCSGRGGGIRGRRQQQSWQVCGDANQPFWSRT